MRAFLLAAGLGTRLRPITDTLPKCLVEIDGAPLLDIWLDALAKAGVEEVLLNTHHLPHRVREHLQRGPGRPPVRLVQEDVLLGSAGTLLHNRDFVAGEEMFLAINADNLTDFDLGRLVDAHRAGDDIATLTVFRAPDPTACGIVEVRDGRVAGFEEKPQHPRGEDANAGIYAFSPAVLDLIEGIEGIEGEGPLDIGYHLLPRLVGAAGAVRLDDEEYFIDIGTPSALARAREQWKGRRHR